MKRILYILLLLPVLVQAQSIHIVASSDTVCVSTPVHFTATATGISVPHYRWKINGANVGADSSGFTTHSLSTGDSVACLLVNATGATIYAVSNCIIMIVQTMPVVTPITGTDSVVCVGATIILSDSTEGGVWNADNRNATVTGGIVTGVFAGSDESGPSFDSIFYIVTNSCGADTAFKIIGIEGLPDANFFFSVFSGGSSSFCVGDMVDVNGGEEYEGTIYLKSGNTLVRSSQGFIYLAQIGVFNYVNIATTACGSDTASQVITVDSTPSAGTIFTTSSAVCIGDTIVLADTSDYEATEWSVSTNNVALINGINNTEFVTGIYAGFDIITLSGSNQCGAASTSIEISVGGPQSIAGRDSVCIKDSIKLKSATTGGTWSSSNPGIASIDASGVVFGINEGEAIITYTIPGGCYDTAMVTVYNCNIGLAIFPNPSKGDIFIVVSDSAYTSYAFINSIGQVVMQQPLNGTTTKVNTQSLAAGVYFVILYGDDKKYVSKFVKE